MQQFALLVILCLFAANPSQALHFTATAVFNHAGVTGNISFTELDNGNISITTRIQADIGLSSWHIHVFPVDYTIDPAQRCGHINGPHIDPSNRFGNGTGYSERCTMATPLGCEAGDLHGKFGNITVMGEMTYMSDDPELQLEGPYSIIGRSLVIHDSDGAHLTCANILIEEDKANVYVATFVTPFAGSIYFRQSSANPAIGTFVYARLYYVDGTSATYNHNWYIAQNSPDYRYRMGECSGYGSLFNPGSIDTQSASYSTDCSPANIAACAVGDLSSKLGTLNIATAPTGNSNFSFTWTDANLHSYTIVRRSVIIRAQNGGNSVLGCAPLVFLGPVRGVAYRPPDASLFTLGQRSPIDLTMLTPSVDLTAAEYQINRDGNIRTGNTDNNMCYSNMVLSPFALDMTVNTEESIDLGNISGKYDPMVTPNLLTIVPLWGKYSVLGHNLMVTAAGGAATCGTINPLGSRVVSAWVNFTSSMMNGWINFRQLLTMYNGTYWPGPTLVNYRFNYATPGMAETVGHNWHVHVYRTGTDGPTMMCGGVGGHYNPYGVDLGGNYNELCNSSDVNMSPLRCEAGDLSGKHGRLNIRAGNDPERTLVFFDPNLPLVGPYTILGRAIAVHRPDGPIMACSNIEPAIIASESLRMAYPDRPSNSLDPRIAVPVAIVDLLANDAVEYGEILVYDVNVTAFTNNNVNCTLLMLRFTEFSGTSPDSTVDLVRRLNQNDLPAEFRPGSCGQLLGGGGAATIPIFSVLVTTLFAFFVWMGI